MNSQTPPRRTIAVLLVDDHRFVATVLQSLVASERDIELHHCDRALDAVARATALAPDVILQDLVMPEMDGLSLVRAYRSNVATARTPVVVLSGNDDEATKAQAMAAGASDYMVKIPPKDVLLASIRRHGRPEEAADMAAISALRESMAGSSPEFARYLVDQFVAEAEGRIARLRDAAVRRDVAALGMIAHSLKGSALIMGAGRLAAACGQIEIGAKITGDDALALLPAVDAEFSRVREMFTREQPNRSQAAVRTLQMVQR